MTNLSGTWHVRGSAATDFRIYHCSCLSSLWSWDNEGFTAYVDRKLDGRTRVNAHFLGAERMGDVEIEANETMIIRWSSDLQWERKSTEHGFKLLTSCPCAAKVIFNIMLMRLRSSCKCPFYVYLILSVFLGFFFGVLYITAFSAAVQLVLLATGHGFNHIADRSYDSVTLWWCNVIMFFLLQFRIIKWYFTRIVRRFEIRFTICFMFCAGWFLNFVWQGPQLIDPSFFQDFNASNTSQALAFGLNTTNSTAEALVDPEAQWIVAVLEVLLFLASVFWRKMLNNREDYVAKMSPEEWSDALRPVPPGELRQTLLWEFDSACAPLFASLRVDEVFEITPSEEQNSRYGKARQDLGIPDDAMPRTDTYSGYKRLYHGSTPENFKSIVTQGFILPRSPIKKMYGQGIYFSDNPNKCIAFASEVLCPGVPSPSYYILASEVALGKAKRMTVPEPGLTESLLRKPSFGGTQFNSAVGLTRNQGGANAQFNEWVVFREDCILPRFLYRVHDLQR